MTSAMRSCAMGSDRSLVFTSAMQRLIASGETCGSTACATHCEMAGQAPAQLAHPVCWATMFPQRCAVGSQL